MKTTKEKILIAISEFHSGNKEEGEKIAQAALDVVCEELVRMDMAIIAKHRFEWVYTEEDMTVARSMFEALKVAADKLRG